MKRTIILWIGLILTNVCWMVRYAKLAKEDNRLSDYVHTVETRMDCNFKQDYQGHINTDESITYVRPDGTRETYVNNELRVLQYGDKKISLPRCDYKKNTIEFMYSADGIPQSAYEHRWEHKKWVAQRCQW